MVFDMNSESITNKYHKLTEQWREYTVRYLSHEYCNVCSRTC